MVFGTNATGYTAGVPLGWEIGFVRRSNSTTNGSNAVLGWQYENMLLSFDDINLPVKKLRWSQKWNGKSYFSVAITFASPMERIVMVITVENLQLAPYVEEGRELTPEGMRSKLHNKLARSF